MAHKLKVLVVDDVAHNLVNTQEIISSVGEYEVIGAEDGYKAMDIIRQDQIDILVTDLIMTGMDGIELAKIAVEHNPGIHTVIVSAADTTDREVIVKAMRAGVSDYVPKPLNVDELVLSLQQVADRKKREKEVRKQQECLEKLIEERTLQVEDTTKSLENEILERQKIESLRLQEQENAMKQDKLASLGEIATGVAHEINQPLTYINTILQTSLEKLQKGHVDPDKLIKKFERAMHQASRITSIITHLRAFGRADEDVIIAADLPEILENSLILLNERIRLRGIDLQREIDEDLPSLNCSRNKMEQLFINFFQNSIDALEEKGEGVISVSMVHSRETDAITLKFSDDGDGMPEEVQKNIFEPFFTTKEVGKGTGLGMAIVFGIVQEQKGEITCSSQKGQGTTFTVTLPVRNGLEITS